VQFLQLLGDLTLAHPDGVDLEAEKLYLESIELARQQEAKSFELRATLGLACLWSGQGKRSVAYDLLAPIYNWFAEGFDTRDLREAKALLDELA
jgi:predicted ATPase